MNSLSLLYRAADKTNGDTKTIRELIKDTYYSKALAKEILDSIKHPPRKEKHQKVLAALITRHFVCLKDQLTDEGLKKIKYFGIGTKRSHATELNNLHLGDYAFYESISVAIRHSVIREEAFYNAKRPTSIECIFSDSAFKKAKNPTAIDCCFGNDSFAGAKNPLVINCSIGFGSFAETEGITRAFIRTCRSLTEPGPGFYVILKLEESIAVDPEKTLVFCVDGDYTIENAIKIALEDTDREWTSETFDKNIKEIIEKYQVNVPDFLTSSLFY